jgi:uncharacterized membrane protein YgcG
MVLCALVLLGLRSPVLGAPPVRDSAHLFSTEAVREADDGIRDLQQRYYKKLVIDTFAAVPTLAKIMHRVRGGGYEQFIEDWARRNAAKKAGPNGVYILICKEPAPVQVQVEAGRELLGKVFSADDCARLREQLLRLFRDGRYNDGLSYSVRFVRDDLRQALGEGAAPPEPFPWAEIVWIILILLAFWVGIEIVQRLAADRLHETCRPEATAYGSAGGLSTAVFAAVTGGALGELWRWPMRPTGSPGLSPGQSTPASSKLAGQPLHARTTRLEPQAAPDVSPPV